MARSLSFSVECALSHSAQGVTRGHKKKYVIWYTVKVASKKKKETGKRARGDAKRRTEGADGGERGPACGPKRTHLDNRGPRYGVARGIK